MLRNMSTLLAGFALLTSTAVNAELEFRAGVETEYMTNSLKANAGSDSDVKVTPFLGVKYEDELDSINLDLDFLLEHSRYIDETFDPKTTLEGKGIIDFIISPETLLFAIEEYADTSSVIESGVSNPNNEQRRNVLSVGPDLVIGRGVDKLFLKARYSDLYYSRNDEDNRKYIGTLGYQHEINSFSKISTSLGYFTTDYKEAVNQDNNYGSYLAAVRYVRELPYGLFDVSVGYTAVEFDEAVNSNLDDSIPYVRLAFNADVSPSNQLVLFVENAYTDSLLRTSDILVSRLLEGVNDFNQNTSDGQGINSTGVALLGLQTQFTSGSNFASIRYETKDYVFGSATGSNDDVDSWKVANIWKYDYSQNTQFIVDTSYENQEFDSNRNNKKLELSLGYVNQFSDKLELGAKIEHTRLDSTLLAADTGSYDNTSLFFNINYYTK